MVLSFALLILTAAVSANAYWHMRTNNALTHELLDPIEASGDVAPHANIVYGSSGFRDGASYDTLRQGKCTSMPIAEDKSSYWFPKLYFHWKNGSVSDVDGSAVIYYLFDAIGKVKSFPKEFRMITGNPRLKANDPTSKVHHALTFSCLDFGGTSTTHNELPRQACPNGIRIHLNFPMCWDGKNSDSPDHRSHVAFPAEGAGRGPCVDPDFPITLPRILAEIYWDTPYWNYVASEAMDPLQPFVFSDGDLTGYGYHGTFVNGWDGWALQRAIAPNGCTCDHFGDVDCCVNKGIFTRNADECKVMPTFTETVTGTLSKLPGNNPIGKGVQVVDTTSTEDPPHRHAEATEPVGKTPPGAVNLAQGLKPSTAVLPNNAPIVLTPQKPVLVERPQRLFPTLESNPPYGYSRIGKRRQDGINGTCKPHKVRGSPHRRRTNTAGH